MTELYDPKMGRLASLRRLYHHVINGGTTQPRDETIVGDIPTAENIARAIRKLERETA